MFARSISIRLKPNAAARFSLAMEEEGMPRLRKQAGFQQQITLLAPAGREAVAISLWDRKEDADAHGQTGYPEMLRALGDVVEGVPHVRNYEVCQSSLRHIAAAVSA